MGAPHNTHRITITFRGDNGVATDPDPDTDLTWNIYDEDRILLETETQALDDAEAVDGETGTFRYWYAPPLGVRGVWAELIGTVDGKPQAMQVFEPVRMGG